MVIGHETVTTRVYNVPLPRCHSYLNTLSSTPMPDIIYLPNSREGSVLTFGQKRLREELKCDPEVIPVERDLWLKEGNIIVVVRNRAFRVHKSTLISRSEVLRDHLALSSRETIVWTAGSVAVPLEGVSPDDVRCLFQVMFCSKK